MRVVLDTDVMVAALRSDAGASRRLLIHALTERFQILLSVPLILEYETVLKRPEHLRAAHTSEAEIDVILDALAAICIVVTPEFSWRPALSDPGDEMILETAINGQAALIVTFNITHYRQVSRFGIRAVRPAKALSILELTK